MTTDAKNVVAAVAFAASVAGVALVEGTLSPAAAAAAASKQVLILPGVRVQVGAQSFSTPQMADQVSTDSTVVSTSSQTALSQQLSKLGAYPDGGPIAFLLGTDGMTTTIFSQYPCVRRKAASLPITCLRGVTDYGELSRFLASEAVGLDCEAVPCSVWAGVAP